MLKKILIFIILLIVLFVGAAVYFTSKLNDEIGSEKIVEMPKNASVSLVVDIFNDNDMLEPGCLFTVWLKIYTMVYDDLRIHPGVYKFTADNTNLDVIKAVFSGQQRYVVKICFPIHIISISMQRPSKYATNCLSNRKKCGTKSLLSIRTI